MPIDYFVNLRFDKITLLIKCVREREREIREGNDGDTELSEGKDENKNIEVILHFPFVICNGNGKGKITYF